ncbi:alpha/beta hydrolase [Botrimarina mediterranea]|uniref:Carboxylesterase NlhH n=1 Tax=Botrimarina mediterranea TaxID=2528022 RepID=A0A518K4K5_9BACT|nr:alpha/beta hydrolase [Botrimarina mediterranea]QDV72707.1 Carboxylesterase NlhH [Botrimarina mediterranea]
MDCRFSTLFAASLVFVNLVVSATLSSSQPLAPTHNDVVYGAIEPDDGGRRALHIDLWLPQASDPTPLVVWIHGGAWMGGSYNAPPIGLKQLLDRGFAVASVEYRLSGEAIAPAQIHDVKGAVRYLRANAEEYNLDPDAFAAWGSSAGGHLTALLATSGGVADAEGDIGGNLDHSSVIQAAVNYFGPTDLLQMNADVRTPPGSGIDHDAPNSPESRLIGFDGPGEGIGVLRDNLFNPATPFPEKASLVRLMNPIEHVTADDAPIFIAHGDQDSSVPILQSVRLDQALRIAGVEHEFHRVVGEGHGGPLFQPYTLAAIDFLSAQLQTVPEPSAGVLMAIAALMTSATRRIDGQLH